MTRMSISGQRNQRGSGIVEGVAGLALIITGTICAVLLLVNCGMAMYHKNRLGFVAMQTASYAASLPKIDQDRTKTFARELLRKMGADSSEAAIEITEIKIDERAGVQVALTNKCILLESGYDFLPKSVALTDVAACVKSGGGAGGGSGLEGAGYIKMPLGSANQVYGKFVWIPVTSVGSASSPPGPGTAYTPLIPLPVRVATDAGYATPNGYGI